MTCRARLSGWPLSALLAASRPAGGMTASHADPGAGAEQGPGKLQPARRSEALSVCSPVRSDRYNFAQLKTGPTFRALWRHKSPGNFLLAAGPPAQVCFEWWAVRGVP